MSNSTWTQTDWEDRVNDCFPNEFTKLPPLLEELQSRQNSLPPLSPAYFAFWNAYLQGIIAAQVHYNPNEGIAHLLVAIEAGKAIAQSLQLRAMMAVGLVYANIGRFDLAIIQQGNAITLAQQISNTQREAGARVNQAIVYWRLNEARPCIECASEAIEMLSALSPHSYLARAWNTKGLGLILLKEYDEAQAAFGQANLIASDIAVNDQESSAYALYNLGDLFRIKGDHVQARAYLSAALHQAIHSDPPHHLIAGDALMYLGLISAQNNERALASQHYIQAQQHLQKVHAPLSLAELYLYWADLDDRNGQAQAAIAHTLQAIAIIDKLRDAIASPNERAKFASTQIKAYECIVDRILANDPSDIASAFYWVEMAKSRVLTELLTHNNLHIPKDVSPEDSQREMQLRQQLHFLRAQPNSTALHTEIEATEKELQVLRDHIALNSSAYQSLQTVTPLTLSEIQAKLPANTVLVEFFTGQGQLSVLLISRQTAIVRRLAICSDDIHGVFSGKPAKLNGILPGLNGYLPNPYPLRDLGEYLLDPLADLLLPATTIYLVPHDVLHYLPLHALPLDDGNCLADGNRRVIYAPSATLLLGYCQDKAPSPHTGVLSIGYNGLDNGASMYALKHAEGEANSIAGLVGGNSVPLVGPAATRDNLIRLSKNYRYLHVSCHGHFDPQHPMRSSILLYDASPDVFDLLQHLELNAELVCLSACETGLSHVMRGDELIGLMRAFLYAGSRSVLMSLWTVGDLSTRLLMEMFYAELMTLTAHGVAAAAALALSRAQASLRVMTKLDIETALRQRKISEDTIAQELQKLARALPGNVHLFDHPFYWAAFYLVGDKLRA